MPEKNMASHISVDISMEQARSVLKRNKAWLIRWTANFDCKEETKFWYVIKDDRDEQGAGTFSSNTRNQIRKSLKMCDIRQISKFEIAEKGYFVYKSSFERYRNTDVSPVSAESFRNNFQKLDDSKHDIWGSYCRETGKLIAYSVNIIADNSCNYSTLKGIPEYMKSHLSFYGLIHSMNEYYLREKHFSYVNDGARSLTEHSNIQEFLIQKFKFRKAYCKLYVEYVWWLKILIKILYPFRNIITDVRIKSILRLEEYRCKNNMVL
jgi:hypothetical protein